MSKQEIWKKCGIFWSPEWEHDIALTTVCSKLGNTQVWEEGRGREGPSLHNYRCLLEPSAGICKSRSIPNFIQFKKCMKRMACFSGWERQYSIHRQTGQKPRRWAWNLSREHNPVYIGQWALSQTSRATLNPGFHTHQAMSTFDPIHASHENGLTAISEIYNHEPSRMLATMLHTSATSG